MISRCTALVRGSQGPRFKRRGSQSHFLGGQGHLPSVCQVPAWEQPYQWWGTQQHPQLTGPAILPPSWEINSIRKQKPEPPNPTNKKLVFLCTERLRLLAFYLFLSSHCSCTSLQLCLPCGSKHLVLQGASNPSSPHPAPPNSPLPLRTTTSQVSLHSSDALKISSS